MDFCKISNLIVSFIRSIHPINYPLRWHLLYLEKQYYDRKDRNAICVYSVSLIAKRICLARWIDLKFPFIRYISDLPRVPLYDSCLQCWLRCIYTLLSSARYPHKVTQVRSHYIAMRIHDTTFNLFKYGTKLTYREGESSCMNSVLAQAEIQVGMLSIMFSTH